MVVQETSRLFPVLPPTRVCTKDWRIPDSDVVIPRGMKVIISMGKETSNPKTFCACFSNKLACIFQKMLKIQPTLKIQKNSTQIDGAEMKSKTSPQDWYWHLDQVQGYVLVKASSIWKLKSFCIICCRSTESNLVPL